MTSYTRPRAIVTGASTGISYDRAIRCAENGFDLHLYDASYRR
jgi:short-subunit dehydrogenase